MTTWNELPAHLVSKIRSDSVTAPANLPGAVPVLKYGNAIKVLSIRKHCLIKMT